MFRIVLLKETCFGKLHLNCVRQSGEAHCATPIEPIDPYFTVPSPSWTTDVTESQIESIIKFYANAGHSHTLNSWIDGVVGLVVALMLSEMTARSADMRVAPCNNAVL